MSFAATATLGRASRHLSTLIAPGRLPELLAHGPHVLVRWRRRGERAALVSSRRPRRRNPFRTYQRPRTSSQRWGHAWGVRHATTPLSSKSSADVRDPSITAEGTDARWHSRSPSGGRNGRPVSTLRLKLSVSDSLFTRRFEADIIGEWRESSQRTASRYDSERRVLASFGCSDDTWLVFHNISGGRSARTPRRRRNYFALFHPTRGILVFEAKGGDVTVRDGRYFRQARGEPVYRDPFEQAEACKRQLSDFLAAEVDGLGGGPRVGRAVAFPHVRSSNPWGRKGHANHS